MILCYFPPSFFSCFSLIISASLENKMRKLTQSQLRILLLVIFTGSKLIKTKIPTAKDIFLNQHN
uniref:Uncharacterized protein n=1 Tax=Amphimedon queenslandica TaxID=400682 RepID=A0A1X7UTS3_AMPQE